MIEEKSIFDEVHDNISMFCDDDCVGADLASAAGVVMSNKMRSICVAAKSVAEVWPWLEKTKVKILSRFFVNSTINCEFMSDLSEQISASFRDGANGAIVFVPLCNLPKFAAEISSVRDDLFFNKTLSIGVSIEEIGAFDWTELFGIMNLLRTDSLTLVFSDDTGNKSDFVGRVYGMLSASWGNWNGAVNFVLGQNIIRIDQVYRLIQQMKPELISKTEFFIDN